MRPSGPAATHDTMPSAQPGVSGAVTSSGPDCRGSFGACVTISDHGNNAGLVLGPEVGRHLWQDLDGIDVSMSVDGRMVGRATTATMLDGPFGAVRFLLANLQERGIAPQPGWWISSGAITGVHEIAADSAFEAVFEGIGRVRASATAL